MDKKAEKIYSELLASYGWQLTETEDIEAELHNTVLNRPDFGKEGEPAKRKMQNLFAK